jgi:hypothetical protein
LEAYVHQHTGCRAGFEEATLHTLVGPELVVALTAMSEGKEFPFVIVGDRLACSGVLDPVAIAATIEGYVAAP